VRDLTVGDAPGAVNTDFAARAAVGAGAACGGEVEIGARRRECGRVDEALVDELPVGIDADELALVRSGRDENAGTTELRGPSWHGCARSGVH
jgi:hypothetical protein